MKRGIVGNEAARFTDATQEMARKYIEDAIVAHGATTVVSGHCHLGGVDIWAEDAARELGLELITHAPTRLTWQGKGGFRDRNLRIAEDSDHVLCVTVDRHSDLRPGVFLRGCPHCDKPSRGGVPPHVPSGGCWTAWAAAWRSWAIVPTVRAELVYGGCA